jgi:biotin carboxylase
MSKKRLLVLAASTYQLDAIQMARELGMEVITTDNVQSNPGHRLADRCYSIDTTDRAGVLELARRERVDGVIAPATDVALETAAYVAAALKLPGPSVESARILTSKLEFRQFLTRGGLPCPRFIAVTSLKAAPDQRDLGSNPWVVKPNRASGAKGVFIIDYRMAVEKYLREATAFSIDGQAIIEQWLDGTQHTCEGFLAGGDLAFVMVTDRKTTQRPYAATAGHFVPTRLEPRTQIELLSQLRTIFSTLEVRDGPFDCDFVSTPSGVYLLEATPRLGGNCLSSLVKTSCGFDIVEAAVRYACGEMPSLPISPAQRSAAVLILGVAAEGQLWFDVDQAAMLKEEDWICRLLLDKPFGAHVRPFINGRERVGEALLTGRDRNDLDCRALEVERRLNLTTKTEPVYN